MSANRRAHERLALSFPLQYSLLPWSRHWLLQSAYRIIPSAERNPQGSPAIPDPDPWFLPFLNVSRFFGELLFTNGTQCWEGAGRIEAADGLDLSEGGLRMTTTGSLWLGAFVHLRIPSEQLAPVGYTVLGKVVRVTPRADHQDVEAGIAFTALNPSDRRGLIRFLTTPNPQLAAIRKAVRSSGRQEG
jgi:hypothetical protein